MRETGKTRIFAAILALILFSLVGFYVNRYIKIEGLYMDDLYMWSCYGEQSFREFAFPIGTSTRFRPVYWTLTYLEMMIVRNNVRLFVPINIILNIGVAFTIYLFARRLSHNSIFSMLAGYMYLISHFAYYQIAQALGLLETMSLFMAVVILWLLYDFLNLGSKIYFYIAGIVYFLLVFSHERYLSLMPLFYIALLFVRFRIHVTSGRGKSWRRGSLAGIVRIRSFDWLFPILLLVLILGIRRFAIGTAVPAGTGGTEVTDTFQLATAVSYALDQVRYIFGINIGPAYLSGITWTDVLPEMKYLVYGSWIPLLLLVVWFLFISFRRGYFRTTAWFGNHALFLGFIALCIGCSSVTIRVEMRWVYVSYTGALLYLGWMIGVISGREQPERYVGESLELGKRRFSDRVLPLLFLVYCVLMTPVERYYRTYYNQIYFWENQDRMNSLAEQTVMKYGIQGVLGKQVYILGNTYEMTDFYARTFFKVYDPEKTGQGTEIHFIESIDELPEEASLRNSIVLKEAPEKRGYDDITAESFRNRK